MSTPTARQLCDATGISPSYAHMILSGDRDPALALALRIWRSVGWQAKPIAGLSDEQIEALEAVVLRKDGEAKAA